MALLLQDLQRERDVVGGERAAVVGGMLTQYLGWRSIFFVTSPLWSLVFVLGLWKLKGEWAEAKGEKFDFVGSSIYSVTLVAIIYGLSLMPSNRGVRLPPGRRLRALGACQVRNEDGKPCFRYSSFQRQ